VCGRGGGGEGQGIELAAGAMREMRRRLLAAEHEGVRTGGPGAAAGGGVRGVYYRPGVRAHAHGTHARTAQTRTWHTKVGGCAAGGGVRSVYYICIYIYILCIGFDRY
jgi:hypothetical protein